MGAMEIKNINIGLTLLLSSAIIYGSSLVSASIYSLVLSSESGEGWDTRYGIFGTALRQVGTLPVMLAVLLAIAGIVLIVIHNRKG